MDKSNENGIYMLTQLDTASLRNQLERLHSDREEWKRRAEGEASAHDDTRFALQETTAERDALRARLANLETDKALALSLGRTVLARAEAAEQRLAEVESTAAQLADEKHAAEQRLEQAAPIIAAVARASIQHPQFSDPILAWNNEPQIDGVDTSVAHKLREAARAYQAEHAQPRGDDGAH